MSPSALQAWKNQRSAFVKSYFEGEKTPETAAMRTGTKIHRMIEMGLIPAKCVYGKSEDTITIELKDGVKFLGVPDDRDPEAIDDIVRFVDYKTGKANEWKEKLPTDIKMKATAWLVWKATGEPSLVQGHIEYIATEWDPIEKDIVPIEGRETELISITYTASELRDFTQVILKAIDEVNEFYTKWLTKSEDAINTKDVARYIELKQVKDETENEMKEIGQRILEQMEFGGCSNYKASGGSFYTITKKIYEYPNLTIDLGNGEMIDTEYAEKIAAAAKATIKNYELATEPKAETTSIGFRASKEK